ncbi:hypothetical protein [Phytohalomonas tamaricis]|uniref:hypothetical protein n=1 Tax=Phytohalomonas tamaricis TaxID=2081032 RepID=UPI000D0B38C1|nr:hypothetical protein [Phytohalomonas tamaricis]
MGKHKRSNAPVGNIDKARARRVRREKEQKKYDKSGAILPKNEGERQDQEAFLKWKAASSKAMAERRRQAALHREALDKKWWVRLYRLLTGRRDYPFDATRKSRRYKDKRSRLWSSKRPW